MRVSLEALNTELTHQYHKGSAQSHNGQSQSIEFLHYKINNCRHANLHELIPKHQVFDHAFIQSKSS